MSYWTVKFLDINVFIVGISDLVLAKNPQPTMMAIIGRLEENLKQESDKLQAATKHPIDIRCSVGFSTMTPEVEGNSELLFSSLMKEAENRMRLVKQAKSSPEEYSESNDQIKSGNYALFLESNFSK